jgi:hypothetical protein
MYRRLYVHVYGGIYKSVKYTCDTLFYISAFLIDARNIKTILGLIKNKYKSLTQIYFEKLLVKENITIASKYFSFSVLVCIDFRNFD